MSVNRKLSAADALRRALGNSRDNPQTAAQSSEPSRSVPLNGAAVLRAALAGGRGTINGG